MKSHAINISYTSCDISELPEAEKQLIVVAREACDGSYSPFSGLNVGVAALLDNGQIVTASNQESEVFPSGMCAERVLIYSVMAMQPKRTIVTFAIASKDVKGLSDKKIYPCGACLQTLADAEKRQVTPIKIIMTSRDECDVVEGIKNLMPFGFSLK